MKGENKIKQLLTENAELRKRIEELESERPSYPTLSSSTIFKENLETYKQFVLQMNDLAYLCDNQGNVIFVNTVFEKMTGHKPETFIGKSFAPLFDEENLKIATELYTKTLAGENPKAEITFKNTNLLLAYSNQPLRDDSGKIIGVIGTAKDITESRHMEDALAYDKDLLGTLFKNIPDFIYFKDRDRKFVRATSNFCRLLGCEMEELIGKSDEDLFPPEKTKESIRDDKKVIEMGIPILNKEEDGVLRDDTGKYALTTKLPWYDEKGNIIGLFGITKDITKLKQIQKELEFSRLKAEDSERLKSSFLSNMSHEIRTPLNAIMGYTELMLSEELSDGHRMNLERVYEGSQLLLNIINDILDFSKIEAGHLDIRNDVYSLKELFDNIDNIAKILLKTKHKVLDIKCSIDSNISVNLIGDDLRLQQVLINLLSNSIKFTETGLIEYGATLKDEHTLEFYVSDSGKGIAPDKLSIIFEPFKQEDVSSSRVYGGTGLGLTISRRLIEMMGGEIRIESSIERRHGTSIYFTLPYVKTSIKTFKKNNSFNNEYKSNQKIMLVEDDPDSQILTTKILKKSGYTVLSATNGQEAVDFFKQEPDIDMILMDAQMPVKTGIEAIIEIRALETKRNFSQKVPIIMLSAAAMAEDKARGLEAGCNDYLTKPLNHTRLTNILNKYQKEKY